MQKQIITQKYKTSDDCTDSAIILYNYTSDSIIHIKNQCPQIPRGGCFIDDTLQYPMETVDSTIFVYDNSGNRIEKEEFRPHSSRPYASTTRQFDAENRVVEEKEFAGDSVRTLKTFECRDTLVIVHSHWFWFENVNLPDGHTITYETHNKEGKKLMKRKVSLPNMYVEKTIYSCRYDGKPDSEIEYEAENRLSKVVKYIYK